MTRPADDLGYGPTSTRSSRGVQTARKGTCERCGKRLCGKSTKRYCSDRCRAAAHRARKTAALLAVLERAINTLTELETALRRDA